MQEKKNGLESLVSCLEKEKDIQTQEVHRTPNGHEWKSPSPSHILANLSAVIHNEKNIVRGNHQRNSGA